MARRTRFRTQRRFLTTIAYGSWLLLCTIGPLLFIFVGRWLAVGVAIAVVGGWGAFVVLVPPSGGRRFYEVTPGGLVVEMAGERLTIPWPGIEYVVHRPVAKTYQDGATTTHWETLELVLHDSTRIFIHDVHRQGVLSKLIVQRCRDRIVHRLTAAFERTGEVEYGNFHFDREGARSPGGFLPWRGDWRIRHFRDGKGSSMMITAPGKRTIGGWVPEWTTARELVTTLSGAAR
ncbi:hypothetical protein GCM10027445_19320 [Amycolatopsis endophytica]|uniref:Uncharacterized protein n=1 Tax=Amycolatopsis endophytica TaxID=860233 RepID=A0A853BF19_9PSEU|nr:hypothetical protein [Amycolatopsis endophytica]NYI93177.1 hypothetical protein [Amycolatopsis endophytica]